MGHHPLLGNDEFSGFKKFEAFPYSKNELWKLVTPLTVYHDAEEESAADEVSNPVNQIEKLLSLLGCASIIVERDYTDRDYKAEFSALYAKRFYTPPPRCDRLHFFSRQLSIDEFFEQIDELKDAYLGFCVVRPTEFNRVGRTVIRCSLPANHPKSKRFLTCRTEFKVHILGRPFKVTGFPFIQQDTQVGVCAHAALWMIGRYMSALGHCHEFMPPDVNLLAKAHQPRGRIYPAEQGLVTVQMLDALHGMGLSAIHYNAATLSERICNHIQLSPEERDSLRSKKLADLAYRYIESRLPVILTTKDHAVVGIGHTLNAKSRVPNQIDQIPGIIVNDDALGPHCEISVSPGHGTKYCFEDVVDLVAVLPRTVMLTGEYAEEKARSALEFAPELLGDNMDQHFWNFISSCWLRTYLIRASEFQQDLTLNNPSTGLVPEVADALLHLDYPQYIWVTEVYASENGEAPLCVGKIILDSTAAKSDRSVMAMVFEKAAILFDRREPKSQPFGSVLKNGTCRLNAKLLGQESH